MKSRWIAVLCLLVLMSVPALAQEQGKPPEGAPAMDPAQMEAMMKAISPGPSANTGTVVNRRAAAAARVRVRRIGGLLQVIFFESAVASTGRPYPGLHDIGVTAEIAEST